MARMVEVSAEGMGKAMAAAVLDGELPSESEVEDIRVGTDKPWWLRCT